MPSNAYYQGYVITGLRPTPNCEMCNGTGVCCDCGNQPEGADCGYCGRSSPRYACEWCWPAHCDVCGGAGSQLTHGANCPKCGATPSHDECVTRKPLSPSNSGCADCGGNGYTTGCGECGRVTVYTDEPLPPSEVMRHAPMLSHPLTWQLNGDDMSHYAWDMRKGSR